ncbi:peroxisomal membrane protein 11A isoform X2 [Paramormyrops kingsleyae]|uniref:Peroxisomal biogenesis factor 11 alpha n=1 Tax=Paramormyrops kingsleyae TaxID=1676925 RepID=A0A3B3QBS8_9TELE|nr:peroxisomal membrane protein 11B-like isoform X2 [Paramormyrops kingsleyae]
MESYIKFTNQTQGRDRIFRAAQYACACVKYLIRNNAAKKELAEKLRNLESSLSAGRKLFRLGNTVSSVDAAAHALQLTDPVLQLCLTGAHLSRALYFACDNLLWARAVGLAPGFDKERWGLRASSCYLLSLLLSLLRDAYVLARLAACYARERRRCRQAPPPPSSTDNGSACCHPPGDVLPSDLMEALWASPAVTLDVVKNACDLFIPLDQLGVYRSGAGVVGLCGLLSSLIGILTLLEPRLKLKP